MDDGENDRFAALEERVETIEADFENKLEDVRDRVVQVKRETDEKVGTDHEHEDLLDRIEELEDLLDERDTSEAVDRHESSIEDHKKAIDDMEDKIDMLAASLVETQDDIDDFSSVRNELDDLADAIDGLDDEVELLATSVIELQDRIGELNHAEAKREALAELFARADEAGVKRAKCEGCGSEIEVGFLMEPGCPHCEATFVDVDAGGLLRSGVLRTGTLSIEDGDDTGVDATASEKSEFLGGEGDANHGDREAMAVPDNDDGNGSDAEEGDMEFDFDEVTGESDGEDGDR